MMLHGSHGKMAAKPMPGPSSGRPMAMPAGQRIKTLRSFADGAAPGHEAYGGMVKKPQGDLDFMGMKDGYGGRRGGRMMALRRAAGFLTPIGKGGI